MNKMDFVTKIGKPHISQYNYDQYPIFLDAVVNWSINITTAKWGVWSFGISVESITLSATISVAIATGDGVGEKEIVLNFDQPNVAGTGVLRCNGEDWQLHINAREVNMEQGDFEPQRLELDYKNRKIEVYF
jgi:hypothetical protein